MKLLNNWHSTFDILANPVMTVGPHGRIIKCNQAFLSLIGKPFQEIIGKPCYEIIHNTHKPPSNCPRLRFRKPYASQTEVMKVNNRWFEIMVDPVTDEKGSFLGSVHVMTDITEIKKAEKKAKELEEQKEMILDSLDEVVAFQDTENRIVWANRRAAESLNIKRKDLIGRKCYELLHPVNYPCPGCPVTRSFKTRKTEKGEIRCPDGRYWYITSSPVKNKKGEIIGVIKTSFDISERKKNELALKESEEKFKKLVETIPAAVVMYKGNHFIYVNKAMVKLTGYSQKELLKMNFWDVVYPEQRKIVKRRGIKRQEGGRVPRRYEIKLLAKDGKVKWVDFTGMTVGYQGEKIGLGIGIDITEQKKYLEKMEFESHLLDSAADSIIAYETDGTIVYANEAAAKLRGFKQKELLGMNIYELIAPELRKTHKNRIKSLKENQKLTFESKGLRKDGTTLPVEISIHFINLNGNRIVISAARDITERARMQEISKKYELLSEHSNEIIIFANASTGKILEANKAAVEMLGYSKEELISKHIFELHSKKASLMNKILNKPSRKTLSFECEYKRKDGTVFPVEVNLNWGELGNEGIIIFTARNISERKKIEKALIEGMQRLQKALDNAIKSLVTLVEKRDPYTAGHHKRVAKLAEAIAKELGLPEEQIEAIKVSAIVHDLGKIYIPSEILSKPAKLSDIEFEMVKTHSKFSYDILKVIEFPLPIAEIVLQHHERVNSSGYPNGLKGNQIKLEAKILAVADVVEAMSSHRPYRPALGIDESLKEIVRNKGILYDPYVVDACIKLFREKGFSF